MLLCAAGLFVFAWLLRFNDPNGSFAFLTDDHFFYLVRGWQILFGDLPVRDFVDHGAPLFYYVAAAVQQVFGRGTLSEIAFCVTVLAACGAGVFLLAEGISGSLLLGVAAALLQILLAARFYNYPKILVYVLAIPALWAFTDRQSGGRLVLVALVTVVGFLFRHDHGVFIGGAFAVLLLASTHLPWRERVRHAVGYGALVVLLSTPYLVFIQQNGGVVTYFQTAAAWAQQDRGRAPVVWPGLFDNPDGVSPEAQAGSLVRRTVATVQDNSVAWLFYGRAGVAAPGVRVLEPVATRIPSVVAERLAEGGCRCRARPDVERRLPPVPAGGASGGSLGAPRPAGRVACGGGAAPGVAPRRTCGLRGAGIRRSPRHARCWCPRPASSWPYWSSASPTICRAGSRNPPWINRSTPPSIAPRRSGGGRGRRFPLRPTRRPIQTIC